MPPERVLVIEDEAPLAAALRLRLEAAGFEAETASTAEEGLEFVRRAAPRCVILDLRMRGMGGFGFLRAVREDVNLRGIPVVVVSASLQDDVERDALELGARACFNKPFDNASLLQTIRRLVAPPTVTQEG